jgi:imidazolonepropionase
VEKRAVGVTRARVRAFGLANDVGALEIGKGADLIVGNVEHPAERVYWIGSNPLHARVWRGE